MGRVLLMLCVACLGILAVCGESTEPRETPVEQCEGQSFENLRQVVHLRPCGKSRCKLRKGTSATVTIRFKPEKEVKNLITNVSAKIAGVDLPFIGVTGTSACADDSKIVDAASGETVSCPLKPGVEYLYTNAFPIETFYPSIADIRVHWALTDGRKDIICFEVPAAIK